MKNDALPLLLIGVGAYFLFFRKPVGAAGFAPGFIPPQTTAGRTQASGGSRNVKWVQESLNSLVGCGLVVDGVLGPLTSACVKRFQESWGINADGIVGPETESYLRYALAQPGFVLPPSAYEY